MDCVNLVATKPILSCVTDIRVGTLANSTAYYVYFKNSANGKLNRVLSTTSNVGLLTCSLNFTPLANATYELWVTLASSLNLEEKLNILIDGIEADTLLVNFKRVYGTGNSTMTANTQTLTLV